MEIEKSTRHAKIIGDFGEMILMNWLSRSGFEVVHVDHTGIDIVAYNLRTKERLGITVKSRTRTSGKEEDSVNVFSYQNNNDDRRKVTDACDAFGCIPWIAVYIEAKESADLYLTSLKNYDDKYRTREGKKIDDWKMNKKYMELYGTDSEVRHIRINFVMSNWF